jgi:ribosomal-protein-alanine N-acetyltransferase
MNEIEISSERIRLRLMNTSDLNSIHLLHSLPETDEFNALRTPEDLVETKNIIKPRIAENQGTIKP